MSGSGSAEHSDSGGSPTQWSGPGGESPAPARNPSPPRELIGLNDSIGGTAFSQHWLFSTLMKLIQVIEKRPNEDESGAEESKSHTVKDRQTASEEKDCAQKDSISDPVSPKKEQTEKSTAVSSSSDPSSSATEKDMDSVTAGTEMSESVTDTISSSDGQHLINISDELQDELCQLWDMSSDSDVAKLLQEYKAVDILAEVIAKSDAPRATEIAVGILGNMACTRSVCDSMAESSSLVNLSLCLLSNTDAPTLVEATRFLNTVLSNEKCQSVWLKAWSEDSLYKDNIAFILQSSVNKDLLSNTAILLDHLLDLSDEMCSSWSSTDLLTSVTESIKQYGLGNDEGTYSYLHVLQLMTTQDNGVAAIVDQVETVTDILMDFLLTICEDEIVNLEDSRSGGVASVISVLNTALISSPAGYSQLYSSEKCIRCILKVVYACEKEVVILGTPVRGSPSQSKGNSTLIKALKDVLYLLIADTVNIMNTEEADLSQCDEKEEDRSERTTPSILKYMNSDCERPRLQSLFNLVLQNDGHKVMGQILNLCEKYKLERLENMILDSASNNETND